MFRFTIIDFTSDPAGIETVVDEPVGWDGITIQLKRDKNWHGFFEFFDDSLNSLGFYNEGFQVLKSAYDSFGVEAKVDLLIEYACAETDDFAFLYQGRFAFKRAQFICGVKCYAVVGVEASDCLMKFRNRYEQKVNLDSLDPSDSSCVDATSSTTGLFTAPNELVLLAPYPAITVGQTIDITGTTLNDGTYTVASVNINFSNYTELTFVETVVDEAPTPVTIDGCIEFFQLPAYDGLGKSVILNGKKILNQGDAYGETGYTINLDTDFTGAGIIVGVPNNARLNCQSTLNLAKRVDDLNKVNDQTQANYCTDVTCSDVDYLPIYEFNENAAIKCAGEVLINLQVAGTYIDDYESEVISSTNNFKIRLVKGATLATAITELAYSHTYSKSQFGTETHNFNWQEFDQVITMLPGEKLWLYIGVNLALGTGAMSGSGGHNVSINTGAYFRIEIESQCLPTRVKSYRINEVFSRLAENYTNDCFRVYSEYFGRVDSEPYSVDADGCGSNEVLSNGLLIRNATLTNGDEPILKVSFKETFEAMKAVHNIGMGLEDDADRLGYKRIRIEPYKHFYNDTVLFVLDSPAEIKRVVNDSFVNMIKVGYQKWEAEETNGLYDLFGNREYKSNISAARGNYDQLCRFIASDYAIEVTRRKFGVTTKDWKYDNDAFIVCISDKLCIEVTFYDSTNSMTLLGLYGDLFEVGDEITITGSASNDGTYTIDSISLNVVDGFTNIEVTGDVSDESFTDVCIRNITNPILANEIYDVVDPTTIDNVLYPETAFNLRITPARNLLRHYPSIAESLSRQVNKILYFTDGNGNIVAEINLANGQTCVQEIDAMLSESANISPSNFDDADFASPIAHNETIEIEYPTTEEQFQAVLANPYGLVGWNCADGNIEYGWIMDFKRQPRSGMTEFVLKPKIS